MKWFPLPVAALAMLGFGLAAYGDSYDTRPSVRSILRAPARQASIRRADEANEPTIVEPSEPSDFSPAEPADAPTGSGLVNATRRVFSGNTNNNATRYGEPAPAMPAHEYGPHEGFAGDCCDKPNSCCDHLWDGFCDEKKGCGKCASCDDGCGKCKQTCCRAPKKYRQDLFTYMQNKRASRQAECGCETESCSECEVGHNGGEHAHPVMPIEAAPPANDIPKPEAAGEVEGPQNERAARRSPAPRRGMFPVRFGGN